MTDELKAFIAQCCCDLLQVPDGYTVMSSGVNFPEVTTTRGP